MCLLSKMGLNHSYLCPFEVIMALFAESIKDSCSFTPNPVLVALSQNTSRYLPPKATRADATFLQNMRIERIPDRSAFLRSSLQQMGWSSFEIEDYLCQYQCHRQRLALRGDLLSSFDDFIAELNAIPDQRNPELVIYPLPIVLFVIFWSLSDGVANDCASIAGYWKSNNHFFQALIPTFPAPHHNISESRVEYCLNMVSFEYTHALFKKHFSKVTHKGSEQIDYQSGFLHGAKNPYFRDAKPRERIEYLGADGQTAEGSMRRGLFTRNCKGTEVATINDCSGKVTLDYVIDEKKNQETAAFLKMLPELDQEKYYGAFFHCDALNSRPELSSTLLELGFRYLLSIKKNAGNRQLFLQIEDAFEHASFDDCDELLKPQKFVVADHGRYEEYTVSILDVSALSAPSVNKHQGTQCIIRKEKVSYQLRKRAPLNEADAKRRETSIKHGAMRAGRRVSYYICSMPYCLETFLHVLQALSKYWAAVEGAHGKLDRYAGNQDDIRGCSDLNYIKNRIGFNKMLLNFWSHVRQTETQKKYSSLSYSPRVFDAIKKPVSFHGVQQIMRDPFKILDHLGAHLQAEAV